MPDNFDATTTQDNLNERDSNGVTPFHVACWNGNIDVVRLLIPHVDVKEKNNFQRSPFLATILGPKTKFQKMYKIDKVKMSNVSKIQIDLSKNKEVIAFYKKC